MKTSLTTRTGRQRIPLAALLLSLCLSALCAPPARAASRQTPPPEVLIYYANETAPDKSESASWDTILTWLDTSNHAQVRRIAAQLRRDRTEFQQAVDREVAALECGDSSPLSFSSRAETPRILAPPTTQKSKAVTSHRTPKSRRTPYPLSIVIFTNRLVRDGRYLVIHHGQTLEKGRITPLPSDNLILVSNPLTRADMFARCLREVARRFDPARHRFILITKSHGSERMAMTPRLAVRAEETTRDELLAVAAGEIADEGLPAWSRRIGVTKDDYFTTLTDVGKKEGMHFALVFMESCHGVLDHTSVRVPHNIERLYMTGHERTEYTNVDYADLLGEFDGTVPFSQLLDTALAKRFPTLIRGHHFQGILFWLPLLAWLPIFVVLRLIAAFLFPEKHRPAVDTP